MRTLYTDLNITFTIENMTFSVLNIVFERFLRTIPKHSHGQNSYEIHYIPYGHGTVNINDHLYAVEPNTLYITGPHVEHEQVPDKEDPMTEYCIYFKIKRHNKDSEYISSFTSQFEHTNFWYGQDTQDIHSVMQQIFFELEHEYSGFMIQVEALLKYCVVKVVRNYEQRKLSNSYFSRSNLVDSKYIVVEECFLYEYQDITLERLSTRLGLSPRQTERFLKEYYQKTFLQKKTEAKMSVAAILLTDKALSITEISKKLGYSSIEHFSSAFKKYYHTTPRMYRNTK